ncbi:MAG TPA: hypothetical protein VGV93_07325 [Acidimicrobiales bacterium]|nr:hypothetical protein [Acidimicrobiales bacterium]
MTGIREGEAEALDMGSLEGGWWAKRTRPGPSESALEKVLDAYW